MHDRPDGRLPVSAYERAERMLGHNRARLALRARVRPNWIGAGSRFWYLVDTERGREFVVVDVAERSRRPAFDQERLARALAQRCERAVAPYDLPFDSVDVAASGQDDEIGFVAFGSRWTFRAPDRLCRLGAAQQAASPVESVSPDGRWVAYRRGHDLWLRSAETGEESALTTDGTAERAYATAPDYAAKRQALRAIGVHGSPVVVSWSPDSRRLLTCRLDQHGVESTHLVEAAPPDGPGCTATGIPFRDRPARGASGMSSTCVRGRPCRRGTNRSSTRTARRCPPGWRGGRRTRGRCTPWTSRVTCKPCG
jgi:dipeptidyl-peptidase 4